MASLILEYGIDGRFGCMSSDDEHHEEANDDEDDEKDDEDPGRPIVIPTESVKVLVVGDTIDWKGKTDPWGQDMSDEYTELFTAPLIAELNKRNIEHGTCALTVRGLREALWSNTYTAVFVADVLLPDERNDKAAFFNDKVRALIVAWVGQGGKLVLRNGAKEVFADWFGKPWTYEGDFYRRTDHVYQHASNVVPFAAKKDLPVGYNVKASMLSHVADDEKLYAPVGGAVVHSAIPFPGFAGTKIDEGLCAIAVGRYQAGALIYIGDVNAEVATNRCVRWPAWKCVNAP